MDQRIQGLLNLTMIQNNYRWSWNHRRICKFTCFEAFKIYNRGIVLWRWGLCYDNKMRGSTYPWMVAQEEIEMYKRVQGIKFNVNPLSFYDEHKSKFPWISALSLRHFCVPACSVSSERIFSLAGHIISQERVRLDPEKADMLIFLHKNADWLTELLKC